MYSQMIIDRKWFFGGPWEIWVKNVDRIGMFIKENKLKAVAVADLPVHPGIAVQEIAAGVKAAVKPRPFPGGMRCAHLHFKGDIYTLNMEQWKSFSVGMIRQYQERLGNAGTVGFDELMDVAAGIEKLSV